MIRPSFGYIATRQNDNETTITDDPRWLFSWHLPRLFAASFGLCIFRANDMAVRRTKVMTCLLTYQKWIDTLKS